MCSVARIGPASGWGSRSPRARSRPTGVRSAPATFPAWGASSRSRSRAPVDNVAGVSIRPAVQPTLVVLAALLGSCKASKLARLDEGRQLRAEASGAGGSPVVVIGIDGIDRSMLYALLWSG